MMFKRKYGDFGMFQLPLVNVFAFVIAFIAIAGFINFTFKPLVRQVKNTFLLNMDIRSMLSQLSFSFDFFSLKISLILIILVFIGSALILLLIGNRLNDDELKKYWVYLLPFFFIYYIIIAYICVRVVFEVLIGKKQKW
jgi:hypothetical protein